MPPKTRHVTVGDVRAIRFEQAALYAVLGVAAVAALISFFALQWVAYLIGVPEWLTWAFPVAVDGVACVASAATIAMHDKPLRVRAYVWCVLGFFLLVSIGGNMLHALQFGKGKGIIPVEAVAGLATLPPLAYAIGVHLYIVLLRHGAMSKQRAPGGGVVLDERPVQPVRASAPDAPARALPVSAPAPTSPAAVTPEPGTVAPAAPAAPRPRPSAPDPAHEEAYALYAEARAAGEPELSGDAIADLLNVHPGQARKVRARWRVRFDEERGAVRAPGAAPAPVEQPAAPAPEPEPAPVQVSAPVASEPAPVLSVVPEAPLDPAARAEDVLVRAEEDFDDLVATVAQAPALHGATSIALPARA